MLTLLDKKRKKLSQWLKEKTTLDFSDWGVFVLFCLGLFAIFYFGQDMEAQSRIPAIVLWFTAIVIMQYTKETYWLKQISRQQYKEAVVQNKLSLLPVLIFELRQSSGQWVWNIKNIGNAPAFNIRLEKEEFDKNRKIYKKRESIQLDQGYCAPGQLIPINLKMLNENFYRIYLTYERIKKSPKPITMVLEIEPTTHGRVIVTKPPL